MLLGSLFSVLLVIGGTYCMSSGPPGNTEIVCNVISPNPDSHGGPATGGNGGYVIATDAILNGSYYEYMSGQTYTVQLLSTDGNPFLGFLVQAWNPDEDRIGTFVPEDSTQGAVDCSTFGYPEGSSTGHRSPSSRMMRTFSWEAPSDGDGMVDFRYAVVRMRTTYFASLSAAAQIQVPLVAVVTDPTVAPTAPPNAVTPTRSPESYRITLRVPSNCAPATCTLFIGVDTNEGNDEYLDVYMEGDTTGWIALGFSETASMFSSDVLACNLNSDNMVEVLDTWNLDASRGNVRDTVEDVWRFSSNFVNGRLTCSFIRNIVGTDVGISDLSLDQPYFLMYGMNPTSFAGGLAPHLIGAGNPKLSPSTIDPSSDAASLGGSRDVQNRLTRAHGILMVIAWPLLAVTAIFFAAWMRPALPNGEWFQVHRAFMIGSLVFGSMGFFLIFVAQYQRGGLIALGPGTEVGTAHFSIGIIVMALHIINPIIALFRCHPGKPNRWIYNLIHGTIIGIGGEFLALVNVGLGIALFSRGFSRFNDLTILWVYLGYTTFFLVLTSVLFVIYTIIATTSDDDDRAKLSPSLIKPLVSGGGKGSSSEKNQGVELAVPGEKPAEPGADEPKLPSRDSPLRWAGLVVFAAVSIPLLLTIIILIGIPQ